LIVARAVFAEDHWNVDGTVRITAPAESLAVTVNGKVLPAATAGVAPGAISKWSIVLAIVS